MLHLDEEIYLWIGVVLLAVLLLGGCTRPSLAEHQAECVALGFTPDTDPHRACVLELRLAEEQRLNSLIQKQTYINSLQ